jgi:signal transduction histidine kinase
MFAMTGLALAGVLIVHRVQDNDIARLLTGRAQERDVFLDYLLELRGESLYEFAYDYTYWDDMVAFVQSGDPAWAAENVDVSLPSYDADAVWIFRPDFTLVHFGSALTDDSLRELPVPEDARAALFAEDRLVHFFADTPAGLIEVRAATIHPTADVERRTPPAGYFFAGRLWDQTWRDDLAELVNGTLSLLPADAAAIERVSASLDGVVTLRRTLNGWDGTPVAMLQASLPSPDIQEFVAALDADVLLYVLFAAALAFTAFVLLVRWVIIPLRKIAASLNAEDAALIHSLRNDRGEFGHIARLIGQFFQQKTELVVEVSERKRAEEEVRRFNDQLEQRVADRTRDLIAAYQQVQSLDRLKSKFITDISHELRTPVTNLSLYVNLLERGKLDKQTEYVAILKDQVARLIHLLEDILVLTSLEAEKTEAFAPINLNTLIDQVAEAQRPRAEAAGLELIAEPAAGLPAVSGDAHLLGQAIAGLVANALTYTSSGQVRIAAFAADERVCLEVRDTGRGIAPEDLPHIFERFYRGREASTVPGSGLGLAIVKEIVDMHGGDIQVESQVGQGSVFRIRLRAGGRPVQTAISSANQSVV